MLLLAIATLIFDILLQRERRKGFRKTAVLLSVVDERMVWREM